MTTFTWNVPYHASGLQVLRENLRNIRALARHGFTMRPSDARKLAADLARAADVPDAEERVLRMVRRALGMPENAPTTVGAGS